jgi:hypothetical protein
MLEFSDDSEIIRKILILRLKFNIKMIATILRWIYILTVLFYIFTIIYDFYYYEYPILSSVEFEVIARYKDNVSKKFKSLNSITNKDRVTYIDCVGMRMDNLQGIEEFINLTELDCSRNLLTTLTDRENNKILPPTLIKLTCSNNYLTSLYGIENCINLRSVDCSQNYINYLWLNSCTELVNLKTGSNHISTLNGIDKCVKLKTLQVQNNFISFLPVFIMEFKELADINIEGNPIETNDVLTGDNLMNFIESVNKNKINKVKVYNDKQNTHNSTITRAIKASIENLLKEEAVNLDSLKI